MKRVVIKAKKRRTAEDCAREAAVFLGDWRFPQIISGYVIHGHADGSATVWHNGVMQT